MSETSSPGLPDFVAPFGDDAVGYRAQVLALQQTLVGQERLIAQQSASLQRASDQDSRLTAAINCAATGMILCDPTQRELGVTRIRELGVRLRLVTGEDQFRPFCHELRVVALPQYPRAAARQPAGSGQERRENERQRGERLVAEMLAEHGWCEKTLRTERKGHPVKVAMARRLRQSTALTQQQIAARLYMGSRNYLNSLLQSQTTPRGHRLLSITKTHPFLRPLSPTLSRSSPHAFYPVKEYVDQLAPKQHFLDLWPHSQQELVIFLPSQIAESQMHNPRRRI